MRRLRYDGNEAKEVIPLRIAIPEVLRRVRLKQGANHVEEAAHQVADDIREKVYDQRIIRELVTDIIKRLA